MQYKRYGTGDSYVPCIIPYRNWQLATISSAQYGIIFAGAPAMKKTENTQTEIFLAWTWV
jgi:hypothetical protein